MTTESHMLAKPRWQAWLAFVALSALELGIACGLGFVSFWAAMAAGCRALAPACDGAGGLAVVVVGIVVGILVAGGYWVLALTLGLARRRRARYSLDVVVGAVAAASVAVLTWREHSSEVAYRAQAEATARAEAAAREEWIAALRANPNGHGPPGVVPPMLSVVDDGRAVEVTNTSQEWLVVALARVLEDEQRAWRACPLLATAAGSDYYRFSIGPGRTARYAPVPDCAAAFEGAPLEYRVGDPPSGSTGWWSDTAFAVPGGRLR